MTTIRKRKNAWLALTLAAAMMLPAGVCAAEKETETEPETETVYAEEKVMYLTDTVRVRADASAESDTVAFADRGKALTVLGELSGWYHVRLDDPETQDASGEAKAEESAKEGYVKGTYLTGEKEEADQAVAANEAEIRRKEAEAAAAAAEAEGASSSGGSGRHHKKSSGKTVVSSQNVDDCDGSGHGTTITTYSDGSTSTSRY